jgi:acyl-CoA synthetase (AMP-forming)/AMP-acid ligase II/acyl carrier protein
MLGSVEDFLEACDESGVTVIDFPTAYWHVIADGLATVDRPFPANVRFAILGGERAKPAQLFEWYKRVGERPIIFNSYGPTEATIVAVACELSKPEGLTDDLSPDELPDIPIGRPVLNVQAYVLDRRGAPTPIGVPGELHLAGAGLAHGYFERPGLTAEKFVPNPFSATPGARMYRTGDLVKYREDGFLEFVGRRDTQVKFRGYRIELEEIETTLQKHAGVQEAVVLLRQDSPGLERLVAYVVRKDPPPTAGDLKRMLAERLPAYMVPTATVFLERLPLNAHGKVDRGALPVPDRPRARRAEGASAPRTPLEADIAAIWQSVLEVDSVGIHDNFFDLGGHSLLLMPVIGELKKKFGVKLTPGELVLPTLGQLAALCEERMRNPEAAKPEGLVKRLLGGLRTLSFVRGGDTS